MTVCLDDGIELVLRHSAAVDGHVSVDNGLGTQARILERLFMSLLENINEAGGSKLLHEEHQGSTKRNISARSDFLRRQMGALEAAIDANIIKDSVANLVAAAGVRSESRKHTAADGA